jgi:hypothetical protein
VEMAPGVEEMRSRSREFLSSVTIKEHRAAGKEGKSGDCKEEAQGG